MPRKHYDSFEDWENAFFSESDISLSLSQASTFLNEAVMNDQPSRIVRILENSSWALSTEAQEAYPIILSIQLSHHRCLQTFMEMTDCANWNLKFDKTLLHHAIFHDALWAIETLIDHGSPINSPDISRMTAVTQAAAFSKEALDIILKKASELDLDLENRQKWEWEKSLPESALTVAMGAYAKGIVQLFSDAELSFLKSSCDSLYTAGSRPNAPIGALALMCDMFKNNFTASRFSIQETIGWAIDHCQADWQSPGLQGLNAPQTAAYHHDSFLLQTLITKGVPTYFSEQPLAYFAMSGALEKRKNTHSMKDSEIAFIVAQCEQDQFYPPFAQNTEELWDYLSVNTIVPFSYVIQKEQLSLYLVTAPSSTNPPHIKRPTIRV